MPFLISLKVDNSIDVYFIHEHVAGLKENLGHDVGQTPTCGGVKRKSRS
jgi:hypothetical protein